MQSRDAAPSEPLRWGGGATWWAGHNAIESVLPRVVAGSRVRVLADKAVSRSPNGRDLLDRIGRAACGPGRALSICEHDVSTPVAADHVEATARAWQRHPADTCILLGGGAVIDLGVLALLDESDRRLLCREGRSGLVLLPERPRQSATRCVAIPTTLGTGAEVSAVACVDHGGKRLVVGSQLRPDIAICEMTATGDLPHRLVREAVVEIAARLAVPFASAWQTGVVHPLSSTLGDEIVLADTRALKHVASELEVDITSGAARLALAAVGAHTHAGFTHVGRASFSSPVWFVATELSRALHVTKSFATALLLPAWARAVMDGVPGWGDAERLQRLCEAVEPGAGAVVLLERLAAWGLAGQDGAHARALAELTRTGSSLVCDVADSSARRWGAGLPMLAGISAAMVATLVSRAVISAQERTVCAT